ncbi:MAG: UpxY family transcription antiterminator [Ignavibacteria bacterium]|nr:UpxY family transcription antiterminator [Ignavibacteria bacterium]
MSSCDLRSWFVLCTRPRAEFKAEEHLNRLEIECYLPIISSLRQWSDRKKKITEPLLRGYIFVYANEKERITALELPSIHKCLSDRGKPAVLSPQSIQNLKKFIHEEKLYSVQTGIVPGCKIRILSGPFAGVVGIITDEVKGKALTVSVELLNRTIITLITDEDIVEVINEIDIQ